MPSLADDDIHAYTFGAFTLDLGRGALLRGDEEIRLRPQSFEVLRILVMRRGQLVTRDELQTAVWGHKVVTDDSLAHCLIDVRKALGDVDRKIIRTVPRRGYIFDEPVTERTGLPSASTSPENSQRGRKRLLIFTVLAATILIGAWYFASNSMRMNSPYRGNSIAVLPFIDLSETQDQQYLGDGLSDEILALLSRSPDLRVISRTSSFSFADRNPDIAMISDTLNVAYVLEGSIRRTGDNLRVTAQLVDASDSSNIWSESFERQAEELLDVQREIAEAVLGTISPNSDANLATPAKRNFSANELMLLALYYEQEVREREQVDEDILAEAIRLYRDATEADPDSAIAYSRLARTLLYGGDVRAAEAPIFKALTLDPNLSEVQETLGRYYWARGLPGAGTAWKRAVELNPNNADAMSSLAFWTWMQGHSDGPEEMYRRALELDPLSLGRHAALGEFVAHMARLDKTKEVIDIIEKKFEGPDAYSVIARLLELTGELDQSIAWAIRARDLEPGNPNRTGALAELYAEIGDFDTALSLEPGQNIGLLYKMRRYDELIDLAELRMIDEPNDLYLLYLLAFAYNATGQPDAAIRILEIMGQPDMAMPEARQALDVEAVVSYIDALDAVGQSTRAHEIANWWNHRAHTDNSNWWILIFRACPLAVSGFDDQALDLLVDVADSPRLPWESLIRDMPCFQRFADNPRYQDMLRKVEARRNALREQLPETLAEHGVAL
jgi:TolB-like protein/DNA-binding winged helix-turn-helix (wHTH) protein/tetratricopeptide (TPR) repeat protein